MLFYGFSIQKKEEWLWFLPEDTAINLENEPLYSETSVLDARLIDFPEFDFEQVIEMGPENINDDSAI